VAGHNTGISTGLPSAYSVTVSSPGEIRWPQNARSSFGLVLRMFDLRIHRDIVAQSARHWLDELNAPQYATLIA
jgi:hypothetical protein